MFCGERNAFVFGDFLGQRLAPQRGIFQIAFAIGTDLPSKINIIRHYVSQTGGSLPKKKAPHKRGWIVRVDNLVAAGEAQNAQQADEDVVQRNIQADRCTDVVGFTATDDIAGFKQDSA